MFGINIGPNLGDDATYLRTIAAAMEGVVLGRPSVAFLPGLKTKKALISVPARHGFGGKLVK